MNQAVKTLAKALLRRAGLYEQTREIVIRWRRSRHVKRWRQRHDPGPPPASVKWHTVRSYGRKHRLRILVETGTYRGDMIEAVREQFTQVYSIELSSDLARRATERFAAVPNVRIVQGDSGERLAELLPKLDVPALFWLDAHYSGGETARGQRTTPILHELELVLAAPDIGHVILIDDARLFGTDPAYPTLEQVHSHIQTRRPRLGIKVCDDIIRVTPARWSFWHLRRH